MGLKDTNKTKGNLQIKMTLFVTSAVLLVSAVALSIISGHVSDNYESMLQERLDDDITAISRIMEQRLLRVEESTAVIANLASQQIGGRQEIDSILCRGLNAFNDILGVSMIFKRGWIPEVEGYYERYAYYNDDDEIKLKTYINGDELDTDPDWVWCYQDGRSFWSDIDTDYLSERDEICFFAPLVDKFDHRIGVVYSSVLASYFTSFVTGYKAREDIDITIMNANGTIVVPPDDYILNLPAERLLKQECIIDNIGWKVILSADREIIDRKVNRALVSMMLLIVLMFVVITMTIKYTVRFVAKPFMEEQQRIEREKAVMDNEMQLAASAQNELIPHAVPPFPDRKGIDVSACLHPARKVGGDLYDYFISGDRLYFCIGDVSGKGLQGSLFMAATHYLFRSAVGEVSVGDAARQMNNSLCTDNAQCRFVTFWMGCLDLVSGVLQYINAGHDSPFLIRDGKVDFLPLSEDMPFGVLEEMEYVQQSVTLMPGDSIFLYTDGVTEAMNADGHEFGREKLLETVAEVAGENVHRLIEEVLFSVRRHSDGTEQSDDITMLCLKFIKKETKQQ